MLTPRETAQFVSGLADDVTINLEAIDQLNLKVDGSLDEITCKWHQFPGHPPADHKHLIDYIFLIDSLNFSFWSDTPCTINGKRGYAGFVSALSKCERIWDPLVYGYLNFEEVQDLFKTDQGECLPMCKERWEIMTSNAHILKDRFDGTARRILEMADFDAIRIVEIITENFPNFNDTADYKGQSVSFHKRAQIFVADVYSAVGCPDFIKNIEKLTMFADYRVPQVLLSMNILIYSDRLLRTLEERLLVCGEPMEVEIRAASIQAVELLCKKMGKCAFAIDYALWDYAGDHWEQVNSFSIHKIRTIYY